MRKLAAFLLLFTLLPLPSPAQPAQPQVAVQREAMKKLDFMLGRWRGEGWSEIPPGKRETFTQTESVQSRLGGLALLVEGRGTQKAPGGEEVTAFEALGVLSYDDQARRYRFVTNTSEGRAGEFELKLIEGGWEWGFPLPQGGHVRYTMRITDRGEWHEVGEFSRDEKTWRKFHEMTLQRVP